MTLDYYAGFEGETEIMFRAVDNQVIVRLWEGYLSDILHHAKLNPDGLLESLALYYVTDTGWYESSPFEIPDNKLALSQLKSCKAHFRFAESAQVHDALIKLFTYAVANLAKVDVYRT